MNGSTQELETMRWFSWLLSRRLLLAGSLTASLIVAVGQLKKPTIRAG